jgi:arginase
MDIQKKFEHAIIVECELGGPHNGASMGGRAFFSQFEQGTSVLETITTPVRKVRQSNTPKAHYLSDINQCLRDISEAVAQHYKRSPESRLLVVAGDHSTACGTLAGLKRAYPKSTIGTIWIDAHADIHSPYTSPSGNVHGMPVAAAAGDDHIDFKIKELDGETTALWEATKDICQNSIDYNNLIYIGIRDLEKAEWDVIAKNNIKYYSVDSIENRDCSEVCNEIFLKLERCDMIYISFDIDALDQRYVPGTGTPVKGGLSLERTQELISMLCQNDKIKALEVVEINPLLDTYNETASRIANMLSNAI